MVDSPFLKNNPNLYVFLPLLYTVWSDAVLTPSEVSTLEGLINSQAWLNDDERKFLLSQLDPSSPPSPDQLMDWRAEIKKVAGQTGTKDSLVDLGIRLAGLYGNGSVADTLIKAKPSLANIEATLGFISHEMVYNFKDVHETITSQQETKHNFEIDTLARLLDGDQAEIIRKVKTLISDPEFQYIDPGDLGKYRAQVLTWLTYLAEQGYGAMAYPKTYGGQDDMKAYFTIMETLSYHDLSLVVKFGVQFGLWGMSVYFLGTEKHHKKYLKDIGSLELPGCFAMTETNHGSNVKGIETTATYNHVTKTFTIHTPNEYARKEYIGNAALHGQMATVFAKLILDGKDYGVSAFVVPLRDKNGKLEKGVTIEDCGRKMGLNGVDNGIIYFNNVVIPKENMLDRFAGVSEEGKFTSPISSDNRRFFTMLGTLVGGRIGIPRSGVAACKSGLTIAVRYGDQRRQFGPEGGSEVPILNYRTHQRRLMPLLAKTYALHFSLQYLTERFLQRTEKEMQEIEALAAGLKAYTTWHTTETLQECRECCGGKGYLSENRIDALKNDTDIYTTFEGDNTVLMQLVAKSRLTEFRQEFSNMNVFTILNYVADQAKTSITEMNPLIVRNTDDDHLLDSEFQLNAFKYRERDILTSAAKRLKRHIDSGMDSFDAFNVCQHHLVEVAFAYVERIVLEQFQLTVKKTEDNGCRSVLKKLCDLYALAQLDKYKGWYLEQGYMEAVKTKAIRKIVNQLCWEIRQDAVPLVNAFNIPDSSLSAPIAVNQ
ncbi:MAG: acyl-CoA dehydrogenase family protein [Cyclobacteriaceae bacterium]|nr:acyl-CoA dehydrogenase family protein [Cyclobacteriaceae bacterium]UYN85233.1 MAG: acyl-CoA dehydrogenase family protein [Cyclobacteriaceae bacterium]